MSGTSSDNSGTGSPSDILARLKAVLPANWYADTTPILDGLLAGLAAGWSGLYGLLQTVRLQTRIATATGGFLDMIAQDFFGGRLVRRIGQSDDALRGRITLELLRERGTRGSIAAVLTELTGHAPQIFEPARATDTGGYGVAGAMGYGVAGKWGSLMLPFQAFVTAYRPSSSGIAAVAGYGSTAGGSGAGGWGVGTIEYADLAMVQGQVTDADIYQAVADVLPVATIAWTAITG